MFKKSYLLLILILATSCVKKNYVDQLPRVNVITLNANQDTLKGTLVEIYKTKSDWEKRTNVSRSDSARQGSVLFDYLVQREFYFYAEWKSKSATPKVLTTRNSASYVEVEGTSNTTYKIDLILK